MQSPPSPPSSSPGMAEEKEEEGEGEGEEGSLQGLQHQQLLQHLGLARLPDLPGQEHLIHHRVDLGMGGG